MPNHTETSDLLISLVHQAGCQYLVELFFRQANAQPEHTPQRATAVFDEPVLRKLRQTFQAPVEHGRELCQALFVRPGLTGFVQHCQANAANRLNLRIEVDPKASELLNLRWETLYNLEDTDFLAVDANQPFSRFLSSSDWEDYILLPRESLRALVVVANPGELSRPQGYALEDPTTSQMYALGLVDVQGEVERAVAALQGLEERPIILADYPGSQGRATYAQVTGQLQKGCDILYLVCHGALLTDMEGRLAPILLLEKTDGQAERVNGENLAKYIHNLPAALRPRLAVLASCQSGGQGKVPDLAKDQGEANEDERSYDHGALAALGPCLVEAGVPAVVAIQDNIKMETVKQFMPVFFETLLGDNEGRVDQAMAVARNQISAICKDWWAPILYLRLRSGRLWYQPRLVPVGNETEADLLEQAVLSIQNGVGLPIAGPWLMEHLLGSPREIARQWLAQLSLGQEGPQYLRQVSRFLSTDPEDLSQMAQYLSTRKESTAIPREYLISHLLKSLKESHGQELAQSGLDLEQCKLSDVLEVLSQPLQQRDPLNTYNILANLPFKIYINASPDNLLEQALKATIPPRIPRVEYFRWNFALSLEDQINWEQFKPSVNEPLIFHMFGRYVFPDSLVLSEDDHFEYLKQIKSGLPTLIDKALNNHNLLILGFNLSDWTFRVLFHSMLDNDRLSKRQQLINMKYKSLAVQVQPTDRDDQPTEIMAYLKKYYENLQFRIYFGNAATFLKTLWQACEKKGVKYGG